MNQRIVIFGAGGHGRVVIDAIQMAGIYQIAFLADFNKALVGKLLDGHLICSEEEGFAAGRSAHAFVAIGSNKIRKRIFCSAESKELALATIVHPAAVVSVGATLGMGTLVMPMGVVNMGAVVGKNVIINTGAIVEHDCHIGNHTHIAPRVTLCGGVKIGEEVLVGAGAVIVPGIKVGSRVTVGAGAVVLADVPDGAIVKGIHTK